MRMGRNNITYRIYIAFKTKKQFDQICKHIQYTYMRVIKGVKREEVRETVGYL